jgi:hypothetical protein
MVELHVIYFFFLKNYHHIHTTAGFDLTTHTYSAGGDNTTTNVDHAARAELNID